MADGPQEKHGAGAAVLALLVGAGGAGRAMCRGGVTAAEHAGSFARIGSGVAHEGVALGVGARAASELNAARAASRGGLAGESALARNGALAGEGTLGRGGGLVDDTVRAPGVVLADEAAHARGAGHGLDALDVADLASNFIPDGDDDDENDDDRSSANDPPAANARAAPRPVGDAARAEAMLRATATPPVMLAAVPETPVGRRFGALPGVQVIRGALELRVALTSVRAGGLAVFFGSYARGDTLALPSGEVVDARMIAALCRARAIGCVLLRPTAGTAGPGVWRAAASAWGATIERASRRAATLTADDWAREVPTREPRVVLRGAPPPGLRVADLR